MYAPGPQDPDAPDTGRDNGGPPRFGGQKPLKATARRADTAQAVPRINVERGVCLATAQERRLKPPPFSPNSSEVRPFHPPSAHRIQVGDVRA